MRCEFYLQVQQIQRQTYGDDENIGFLNDSSIIGYEKDVVCVLLR